MRINIQIARLGDVETGADGGGGGALWHVHAQLFFHVFRFIY